MPFESINEFIKGLFCQTSNAQSFYLNACISNKFNRCGKLSLLEECMHESSSHKFGQTLVDAIKFKNVEYAFRDGKTRKHVNSITKKLVCIHSTMILK